MDTNNTTDENKEFKIKWAKLKMKASKLVKNSYSNRMAVMNIDKLGSSRGKSKCEGCEKIMKNRFIVYIKGKYLCSRCRQKRNKNMQSASIIGRPMISLEEALNKVYLIPAYMNNSGTLTGNISLPSVLVGKKVKLVLVEE